MKLFGKKTRHKIHDFFDVKISNRVSIFDQINYSPK